MKNFKKTKIFYFVSCFICLEDFMNYNISLLTLNMLDIVVNHRKCVLHNKCMSFI